MAWAFKNHRPGQKSPQAKHKGPASSFRLELAHHYWACEYLGSNGLWLAFLVWHHCNRRAILTLLSKSWYWIGLVMCWLRSEARSQAKPGQKKPGQAGPLCLVWGGFWPGLWFLKAQAASLSPGFRRYIFRYFVYQMVQIYLPKIENFQNWPKMH